MGRISGCRMLWVMVLLLGICTSCTNASTVKETPQITIIGGVLTTSPQMVQSTVSEINPADGVPLWHGTALSGCCKLLGSVATATTIMVAELVSEPTNGPDTRLFAYRRHDGVILWQKTLPGYLSAMSPLDGDHVYLEMSMPHQRPISTAVVAMGVTDGTILWQTTILGYAFPYGSSVIVGQGTVYAIAQGCFDTCSGAGISAMRATDGTLLWQQQLAATMPVSAATVSASGLYLIANNMLVALRLTDGQQIWHQTVQSSSDLSRPAPFAAHGMVYCLVPTNQSADANLTLEALDGSTGVVRWQNPAGQIASIAALDNTTLYVSASDFTKSAAILHAIQGQTGQERWHVQIPRIGRGVAYLLGDATLEVIATNFLANQVMAYATSDGHLQWHDSFGKNNESGSVMDASAHGVTYLSFGVENSTGSTIVEQPMTLYAVRTSDGHLLWQAQQPGIIEAMAVS